MFRLWSLIGLVGRATAFATCLGVGGGCSWILNPSAQQCSADTDCLSYGAQFVGGSCVDNLCVPASPDGGSDAPVTLPTGWECVGNNNPVVPVKPQVQLTITVGDLIHPENSVSDAVVMKSCRKLDVACATPIVDRVRPDASGHATFTVEGGFDGYIEVDPAVSPPIYVPTLIFISIPLADDAMNPATMLVSIADLAALSQSAGGMVDTKLGAVIYRAANCQRMNAAGIVAKLDSDSPDTKKFFFVGGLPTQTANATDASGLGGFINVPVGVRSLSGTRTTDDLFIGTVSVLVRPGFFSYSLLAPQPL